MTLEQILNAYEGYDNQEERRTDILKTIIWEATRWSTWRLWNVQVAPKDRKRNPMHFLKLPWEKAPVMTDEEKRKLKERGDKFPKRLKDGNK